jgi:hypothetical protein
MEKGNKVVLKSDADCNLPQKEYVIEGLDTRHIAKGDGPESIRKWLMVRLKGISEPQWARNFEVKVQA